MAANYTANGAAYTDVVVTCQSNGPGMLAWLLPVNQRTENAEMVVHVNPSKFNCRGLSLNPMLPTGPHMLKWSIPLVKVQTAARTGSVVMSIPVRCIIVSCRFHTANGPAYTDVYRLSKVHAAMC